MFKRITAKQLNYAKDLAEELGIYDQYDWHKITCKASAGEASVLLTKLEKIKNERGDDSFRIKNGKKQYESFYGG